jgi:ABC-type multidrug transport system fused ATPase/permease subunit
LLRSPHRSTSTNTLTLNGLNTSLKPGYFYALGGPIRFSNFPIFVLLERFYYHTSGSVIINNQDAHPVQSTSFRGDVTLMPQYASFF